MSNDALHLRGKSLEDLFFEQLDQAKLAQIRAKAEAERAAVDLEALTGIAAPEVLQRTVALGVTPETLTAFSLVPLLHVAWADRLLDDGERTAILTEATAAGLSVGTPGYELLQSWLTREPNEALFEAWKAFHAELAKHLSEAEKASLKAQLVDKASRVARASGGFLGFGAVSEAEQAALAKLEAFFA